MQRAIDDESDFLDDSMGSDSDSDKSGNSSSSSSTPSEVSVKSNLSNGGRKTRNQKKKNGGSDESD